MSTSSTNSPFRIREADLRELERNEEFMVLRQRLERIEQETGTLSFCPFHQQSCSPEELSAFRLHRDILHAIFAPLFKIHKYATQVASHLLQDRKSADAELAFRGDARSAYSWLNCFLAEEHDWCSTQGCPACVVLYVLDSEPTIRITAVACLLSDYIQETVVPDAKRRLLSFDFWLGAVETAVREDQFWGDAFWPEIEYRAWALENGIKQLISQCLELRDHKEVHMDRVHPGCTTSCVAARGPCRYHVRTIALQPSSMARRQLRMTREEQEWISRAVVSYWRLLCRNGQRLKPLELTMHSPRPTFPRTRSLTS
ncbi:hypothetical protein DTO207G8_6795 [Paecilomyces variotii]|nr:hypothetical protein DTO207G8_6795 [Paecilomyces variotii]KAJ9378610.1 hypothetical protein DTO063F5_7588 [Paecilomyces variotii]